MHHESRGLRHDDHVVVGMPDVDLDGRVGFGRRAHGGLLEHFDHGALDQLVALAHRAAVDHDRAPREQHLHVGATPPGEQRDGPIDPLAGQHRRNGNGLTHRATAHFDSATPCGLGTSATIRRTAPIVTQESATLNSGHHPTETKSTT